MTPAMRKATTGHFFTDCSVCGEDRACTLERIDPGSSWQGHQPWQTRPINDFLCGWCSGIEKVDVEALDMIFEKAEVIGPDRSKTYQGVIEGIVRRSRAEQRALLEKYKCT